MKCCLLYYQVFCMQIGYLMYVLFIFTVIHLFLLNSPLIYSFKLVNKRNLVVICILQPLIKQFFKFGHKENTHNLI